MLEIEIRFCGSCCSVQTDLKLNYIQTRTWKSTRHMHPSLYPTDIINFSSAMPQMLVVILIPAIEGAGGVTLITDWKGHHQLSWEASSESRPTTFNVVPAGHSQMTDSSASS
ncbi:hypothetical protein ACFE04_008742 [Oxalis oulophora]